MFLKPSSSAVIGFPREARGLRTPPPAASFQRLFPISKSNHLLIIEATRANPITRRQPFPYGKSVSPLPRWPSFWGAFFLRPISFCQWSARGNSIFLPSSLPSSKEASPPLRRRCLQAKFTAAPGSSLRRCRPGAGQAEAPDRALFICKGGGWRGGFARSPVPPLIGPLFRPSRWRGLTSLCERWQDSAQKKAPHFQCHHSSGQMVTGMLTASLGAKQFTGD